MRERFVFCLRYLILLTHFFILLTNLLIFAVERVNLRYIIAHDRTKCSQLFLEGCNLACIGGFGDAELFEQVLYTLLLLSQFLNERVVGYIDIISIILHCKVFILAFELLFLKRHHLLHSGNIAFLTGILHKKQDDTNREDDYDS